MKRYLSIAIIAIVFLGSWQVIINRQAQANIMVALTAFGQATPTPIYRPPIFPSEATLVTIAGQLAHYKQVKAEVGWAIDKVTAKPVGFVVSVSSGESVSKDDWILEANTYLASIDAQIVALEAL